VLCLYDSDLLSSASLKLARFSIVSTILVGMENNGPGSKVLDFLIFVETKTRYRRVLEVSKRNYLQFTKYLKVLEFT